MAVCISSAVVIIRSRALRGLPKAGRSPEELGCNMTNNYHGSIMKLFYSSWIIEWYSYSAFLLQVPFTTSLIHGSSFPPRKKNKKGHTLPEISS